MRLLLFLFFISFIHSCNNSGEGETVKIPPGCDTTGIYLALDSCKNVHPRDTLACYNQQFIDNWCNQH